MDEEILEAIMNRFNIIEKRFNIIDNKLNQLNELIDNDPFQLNEFFKINGNQMPNGYELIDATGSD